MRAPPLKGPLLSLERRLTAASPGVRWLAPLAWFAVISVLSHVRGTDVDSTRNYLEMVALGDLNGLARVAAHSVVFGVLAILLYGALGAHLRWRGRRYAEAVALTGLAGLLDELHQSHVALRHGRLIDAAVDAIGGAVALGAVLWYYVRLRTPEAADTQSRGE